MAYGVVTLIWNDGKYSYARKDDAVTGLDLAILRRPLYHRGQEVTFPPCWAPRERLLGAVSTARSAVELRLYLDWPDRDTIPLSASWTHDAIVGTMVRYIVLHHAYFAGYYREEDIQPGG